MLNKISQDKFQEVLDKITKEVTEKVAGIKLYQSAALPSNDITNEINKNEINKIDEIDEMGELCTVYVDFNSGFHFCLSMCAEVTLFTRLTQYMMQQDEIHRQDMEDFVREYFNVLCGQIAAGLFQTTNVAARFGIPSFQDGRYQPCDTQKQITLCYASDRNESVQLTHNLAVG